MYDLVRFYRPHRQLAGAEGFEWISINNINSFNIDFFVVRSEGLEPPRFYSRHLKRQRLYQFRHERFGETKPALT